MLRHMTCLVATSLPILLLMTILFGLPQLQCTQIQSFSLGGDPVSPSLWNKMFHTLVPYSSSSLGLAQQRTHCSISCMQLSTTELPCNTFIIHQGACYLGDVKGNHTLIQTGTGGTGANVPLFSSNSEGTII